KGVETAVAERQPRNHPIGPGLGQDEHRALTERIADALANEVQLCPPLTHRLTVRKAQRHPLEGELRDMPVEERLSGFVRSIGPRATIEVFYQTPTTRDMIVDAIKAVLLRERPQLVARPSRASVGAMVGTGGEDVAPVGVGVGDAPVGEGARPAMDGEAGSATRRPRVRETEPEPPPALNEEQVALPGGGRLRILARPQEGRGDPLP